MDHIARVLVISVTQDVQAVSVMVMVKYLSTYVFMSFIMLCYGGYLRHW